MPLHLTAFFKTIIALAALAILALAIVADASTRAAQALAPRLAGHVLQVAPSDHDTSTPQAPQDAAGYIEAALAVMGYEVTRRQYTHGGRHVRNLEVSLRNVRAATPPERIFIIGAHYDSARGAPAASENDSDSGSGSGTAAVLELARMLKGMQLSRGTELKFVFFINEGPPCVGGEGMESWQHALHLPARGLPVHAARMLETMGYASQAPGSARYRPGLEKRYPDKGNFIAFVGTRESSELVRKTLAAFKAASPFPAEGLAAPSYVEGVTWSDQASYNRHDYPALMITDTAFLRYPYYHTAQDTPDKPDYASMARVVEGLARVIEAMAGPTRM